MKKVWSNKYYFFILARLIYHLDNYYGFFYWIIHYTENEWGYMQLLDIKDMIVQSRQFMTLFAFKKMNSFPEDDLVVKQEKRGKWAFWW